MPFEILASALVLGGVVAVGALTVYAAYTDLARMLIPNWISIAVAALFLPCALAAGVPLLSIAIAYGIGFVMMLVGFGLFRVGVMGGGDAKLIAALSIWAQMLTAHFLVFTVLAGGILTLVILGARFALKGRNIQAEWAARLLNPKNGAPYAVAICAGALYVGFQYPPLGAWS
jgi:prepilin peptidase CpaA